MCKQRAQQRLCAMHVFFNGQTIYIYVYTRVAYVYERNVRVKRRRCMCNAHAERGGKGKGRALFAEVRYQFLELCFRSLSFFALLVMIPRDFNDDGRIISPELLAVAESARQFVFFSFSHFPRI